MTENMIKQFVLRYVSIAIIFLLIFTFNCNRTQSSGLLHTPFKVLDKYDQNREYKLYLPESKSAYSLLVYFHGVISDGFKKIPTLKSYTGSPVEDTGLIDFCKLNKIALLVPKSRYSYTFLNCKSYGWSPFAKEIDGIEKIIDTVVKNYKIDKRNIYLSGISAGAVLCHHLANRRPEYYNAILSHSQGYISEDNIQLKPLNRKAKFGVVVCYTRGDYKNLIPICEQTYKEYKSLGYKTVILRNLLPKNHSWDKSSNRRFWNYLKKVGQYSGARNEK